VLDVARRDLAERRQVLEDVVILHQDALRFLLSLLNFEARTTLTSYRSFRVTLYGK
jgi:hypothetical protein